MHPLIRYGDIIAITAAGITLAAVDTPTGAWIFWGICAAIIAAVRIYRVRLNRR
ncbi:hypothetical protein [Streptomyces sp. SID8352]|uniref:hypothetical protein n=1 Tax=Streptomyces sp. SID8352 TaxID=2690338 RepID=UPI0013702C3C|nr:hypothetical protein [Streptomyces sp. SID8352]MYU24033.1 hypothetical protein [Streptomyces sp. SID8352]